ncbi:maleylpyruvate isomerase N-terminal domain-containing protein [Ornithinimicrobium sp. W1665]|uniref:maleylpyruvate isomerase N-terminal domain-containing protein n=1 Tax=Ornithinimicrobium sp. W1665 TaxID=3416666 RepID=UPI003CF1BD80
MQHRSVEEHVAGLLAAAGEFEHEASTAGLDAAVPTCPRWTVRDLVAHQGMVHRWARATLLQQPCHPPGWNAEGHEVADPVAWLAEGAAALATTIGEVADDVAAMVFLRDAPPPRTFWARRQCHETTIHAVDALAARLGGAAPPDVAVWIDDAVALDGVDELLTGFVTRGRSRFRGAGPLRFVVRPDGSDRSWTVRVADDGAVTTDRDRPARDDDPVLAGTPRALYLTLWNRAAPGAVKDDGGVLEVWRGRARVRWS